MRHLQKHSLTVARAQAEFLHLKWSQMEQKIKSNGSGGMDEQLRERLEVAMDQLILVQMEGKSVP